MLDPDSQDRRTAPRRDALRVLLLDSIREWGGGEKWCVETARWLSMRGHRIALGCARGSALEERAHLEGLPTFSAPLAGPAGLTAAIRLSAFLRREGIRAVVANVGRDLRIGALACGLAGARLVQRRGLARSLKRDPLSRWLYRRAVRRVVANCEAIRSRMLQGADFVDPARFVVIPNAIEVGPPPEAGRDARLRAELSIDPDAPLVGAVGRLARMKGHEHLLAAWPAVRARVPGAVLLVAGEGSEGEGLRRLAGQLELGESARFLGFRADAAALISAIDVLAIPSVRDEGCNNALLEAMARGRPAVVSDCEGLPEVAVDGSTATVVPRADPEALAGALAGLLESPAERKRMGEAARRRAIERYSVEAVLPRWEELLAAVIADAPPAAQEGPR